MTSFAFSLQPKRLQPPQELSLPQRFGLTGLVLAMHVGAAGLLWKMSPEATLEAEAPAITVDLISEAPQTQAVQPPVPQPEPPKPVPVVKPRPTPPTPRPETPVVASTRAAQPDDMQAPVALPTPPKPVEPSPPIETPPPTPAAPVAPVAPAGPVTAAPAGQAGANSTQPKVLPSSAVRYLVMPVLTYPRASRDLGEQGVVRLKVLVDEQGRPKDIEVVRSSGHPRLDQQATLAMKKARFQPHLEEGKPRMVWVVAPLTFNLEE